LTIPPLRAGEVTVVRVPSVAALNSFGTMFRLALQVVNPDEKSRRIVLEGRSGFSKVVGLMNRQNQMAVSPAGRFVISGYGGFAILTDATTLQASRVAIPESWGIAGAAFSPDEVHVVITLVQPEQKRIGYWLSGRSIPAKPLPDGYQFIRWLDNDTVLVKKNALAKFDIAAGTLLPIAEAAGWTVNTVIPGTAVQILTGSDGRIGIREAGGPVHQVLAGVTKPSGFAVADDLSMFGALDDQKRLWIQHGISAKPEVAAEQVDGVAWGPISRRVLVQGPDRKSRVYDGRNRSWLPLPPVLMAQWSADEQRMLYVEGEKSGNTFIPQFLSLLSGKETERLCDMGKIGGLAGIAFSRIDDTAFLLSGPDVAWQVWMMALHAAPPSTAGAADDARR
jgi:hypothetical protein